MEAKISYLFDEIGKIDDKFVNEALPAYEFIRPQYGEKRRERRGISRALALVAAVVLVFVLSLGVVANLEDILFSKDNESVPEQNVDDYKSKDRIYAQFATLDAQSLGSAEVTGDVNDLLYDSSTRLIWTFGDGVYYSVTVRNSAYEDRIEHYLKSDFGEKASPDDEFSDFKFWISYGNGKCVTPYLERNGGRESYGIVSDYLPEIYPSDAFASFIGSLIREQI